MVAGSSSANQQAILSVAKFYPQIHVSEEIVSNMPWQGSHQAEMMLLWVRKSYMCPTTVAEQAVPPLQPDPDQTIQVFLSGHITEIQ